MSKPNKKLALAQQQCVDELKAMVGRLELIVDGPLMKPGALAKWFPGQLFVEGQVNVMLITAAEQLRLVLAAFDDCAEDGVNVGQQ